MIGAILTLGFFTPGSIGKIVTIGYSVAAAAQTASGRLEYTIDRDSLRYTVENSRLKYTVEQ